MYEYQLINLYYPLFLLIINYILIQYFKKFIFNNIILKLVLNKDRKMSGEQSSSTRLSNPKEKKEDDINKQILDRIKSLKDTKFSGEITDYVPKLIVAFVSMMSFLMTYQINTTSSYIGSGLRVPSHNVGIYVAKITSYRSFLMMLGFGFAYLIYYICTLVSKENYDAITLTLKIISLFFLYLLMVSRWCLLFSSFLTKNLSYNVYFFLSTDALAAGAFQMSLILLIPQFIFIIFLSIHLLALLFFLTQFVFDLFLSNKPLVMLRIQFSMCLIVSYIGIGLWAFYLFYYYDDDPKSYKEELYKQNKNMKKANNIYQKLKEKSKKAKEIIDNLTNNIMANEFNIVKNDIHELSLVSDQITDLTNGFGNLLNELVQFIKDTKEIVNKFKHKENNSDYDEEKDKKKFISQKTNHYDDKYTEKVSGLRALFTKEKDNDLSDLFGRLLSVQGDLEKILTSFIYGNASNGLKNFYADFNEYIKETKYLTNPSISSFNLENPSKSQNDLNRIGSELKASENKINAKISYLKTSVETYIKQIEKNVSDLEKITKLENEITKILFEKHDHIIFCYVMIAIACFFRDFFYPPIIPHALLIEYESQKILLLGIILQLLFCFPVFILDEILNIFTLFMEDYFIYFWTLSGPPFIVLIFTFLAIHTKIPFFHLITGSTGRVFILILFLIPFYTLMESVSYAYLSHHVFYQLGFSHKNLLFLLFHQLLEMFCTYFFSKLSAGYNHARVRLGHCLPTYTTNYEMDFWQELWSMVKWTLQYTFKDILFFFRTNIRQYL
ncbi:uncharacterized protein TA10420 [Theileria annulata]|uniref:Uncharacterized protein n=1 Tax=Theileria annulata TaxID=5874 RepID=Q4U8E8_THEAN|nr:uncharacterized protein TA10420 [Theileria annulata]CAI76905.1 hypothetical protein TA10420 [Theileria annulata]|eukprot:XP_953530.1 hypothetical protein TA10420 [Theileria annulata]